MTVRQNLLLAPRTHTSGVRVLQSLLILPSFPSLSLSPPSLSRTSLASTTLPCILASLPASHRKRALSLYLPRALSITASASGTFSLMSPLWKLGFSTLMTSTKKAARGMRTPPPMREERS